MTSYDDYDDISTRNGASVAGPSEVAHRWTSGYTADQTVADPPQT